MIHPRAAVRTEQMILSARAGWIAALGALMLSELWVFFNSYDGDGWARNGYSALNRVIECPPGTLFVLLDEPDPDTEYAPALLDGKIVGISSYNLEERARKL